LIKTSTKKDGFYQQPDGSFFDSEGYYFNKAGYDEFGGYRVYKKHWAC